MCMLNCKGKERKTDACLYRKQRNAATANAQLSQWTSLVLDYCRHHRLYRLDLGETTLGHELWRNASIQRRHLTPSVVSQALLMRQSTVCRPTRCRLSNGHPEAYDVYWFASLSADKFYALLTLPSHLQGWLCGTRPCHPKRSLLLDRLEPLSFIASLKSGAKSSMSGCALLVPSIYFTDPLLTASLTLRWLRMVS